MRQRTIRYFLLFCLMLSFFQTSAFAEGAKQQKEGIFTFLVEDGYATITNVDDVKKIVSVPDTLGGVPVTALAGGAFGGSVMIEEVLLPATITSIESMCFSYCTELSKVTLPKKLTRLENGVFNHCSKLRDISIPESVTDIEKDAFYRCDELWTITIPDSVVSIGDNAFAACPNLSAATIPESVTTIGKDAFQKNDGFHIYAKPGSVAESYALANGIIFEELITISVNGTKIVFDQPPVTDTINFRTLVPMRAIMETLGAKITWDEKTDSSQIIMPNNQMTIRVGESSMIVNGVEYPLSTPAIEYNWRTMVPIRDVMESIGGTVSWDEEKKHIEIQTSIMSID